MRVLVEKDLYMVEPCETDDCNICANYNKCPLVETIANEQVVPRYSAILIKNCNMYKPFSKLSLLNKIKFTINKNIVKKDIKKKQERERIKLQKQLHNSLINIIGGY